MQLHLLSTVYLVITSSNAVIICPAFLQSETIPLQYTNTVFEPNCDAGDANICIPADGGFPEETVEGWKYVNPGNNSDGRGNKINWYFQASWYLCPTPDILLPSPSDITPSLTVGCLNELSFTVKGKMESIFIRIYTKPKDDENDIGTWYRSRLLISTTTLNTDNAEFTTFTTITASDLNDPMNTNYSLPLQANTNNGVSNSKATDLQEILDNEEILAIAFSTNSGNNGDGTYNVGQGENDFVIRDFTVQYDVGCTCPTERILDLTGIPFQDIGADCTVDIGSCDECTCKQQCVHQDGVDGGFYVRKDITSSDECCAICNQINDAVALYEMLNAGGMDISPALLQRCMGYTYLTGWDKSECCQQYEAGDCILFGSKLRECTQSKYGISGSINDGLCDIASSIDDCCDDIDCVDGICDTPGTGPAPPMPPNDSSGSSEDDEEMGAGWVRDDDDGGHRMFDEGTKKDNNENMKFGGKYRGNLELKLDIKSLINLWAIALIIVITIGLSVWCFVFRMDKKERVDINDENLAGFDINKITSKCSNDEYDD